MKYSDDIDFYYVLENHGWSTCYIYIESAIYEMGPTHIHENPITELLNAFILLLNGGDVAQFKWYDEPGEYLWLINRNEEQKHKIKVSISGCYQINSKEAKPKVVKLEFEVKLKLFCICILKQMEKIQELMKENSYKEHRKGEFPYSDFKEFQIAYDKKYS